MRLYTGFRYDTVQSVHSQLTRRHKRPQMKSRPLGITFFFTGLSTRAGIGLKSSYIKGGMFYCAKKKFVCE